MDKKGADKEVPSQDQTLSEKQPWHFMFTEVLAYHELITQMVLRDLRLRYKQTIMGFAWALFTPLVMVLSGCMIKFVMAQMSGSSLNIMGLCGMTMKTIAWGFVTGCISAGNVCLISNMNLVTKIYFPREVFFFNSILVQMFDVGVSLIGLAVFFLCIGVYPTWQILWVPLLILMLVCMVLAFSMVLSITTVFYRDVKYIVTIIISFGIFYAPVYYEPEIFGPIGSQIMMLNPASPILEGIRLSVAGLPQHMVTDEYQQNAKAVHDRYVARKKAQIYQYFGWSAPSAEENATTEESSQNVGEYMRKLSEMNSGKPSEYRTVNLMRTPDLDTVLSAVFRPAGVCRAVFRVEKIPLLRVHHSRVPVIPRDLSSLEEPVTSGSRA